MGSRDSHGYSRLTRFWFSAALALSLGACQSSVSKPAPESRPLASRPVEKPLEFVILHTNDIHGQALPRAHERRAPGARSGGFAALATLIRRERDAALAAGKAVLLLDAGDLFQGTPEGNLSRGRIVVDFMNEMGYDAVAIGNHEFDFGPAIPKSIAKNLKASFLGANVIDEATGTRVPWLKSHTFALIKGVNVLIVGLTTSGMKSVTAGGVTDGLRFDSEKKALAALLKSLNVNGKGRMLTILLSHCGVATDEAVAKAFPALDVIVGGHSHTAIEQPRHVGEGKTLVTQAGAKTYYLGRIDLTVDPKTQRVISSRGRLIPVEAEKLSADPKAEAILRRYAPTIAKVMDAVLGEAKEDIRRSRGPQSSPMGNFLTDTMRAAGKTDVAFQNKGGIRSDIAKGKVRFRDVYEVSPFGNTLVTMRLTGDQIRRAMEICLATDHSFLEISGMSCRHDLRKKSGRRVLEIRIAGKPLELKKSYSVAVNSFLAAGGDKYSVFQEGSDRVDTHLKLRDLERQAVEKAKRLVPNREMRLKSVVPLPE